MEEKVRISMLCQIYGKMLTEKQYEVINDYYNDDLSLSEIAISLGAYLFTAYLSPFTPGWNEYLVDK